MQQIKIPVGDTDHAGRGLQISRSVSWTRSSLKLNRTHTAATAPEKFPDILLFFLMKKIFFLFFSIFLSFLLKFPITPPLLLNFHFHFHIFSLFF